MKPLGAQAGAQGLDGGFMGHGREGKGAGARRLGGVLARLAVDHVDFLGAAVVGLQLVIRDGPGRRRAAFVLDSAEVLATQARQRRSIHLGVAADEVVNAGLERLAVRVVPVFIGLVPLLVEDSAWLPVLRLLG